MIPNDFKFELVNLGKSSKYFKPHKYVALLAAIKILSENSFKDNRVYYTDNFKRYFSEIFSRYSSGDDRNRSYTPFFHLKTSSFWKLVPKQNMEQELETATTVGGPTALSDIVEFAELLPRQINI